MGIYRWQRKNRIIPYMQMPVSRGRFRRYSELTCSLDQYERLFKAAKRHDEENNGMPWLDVPPNIGWPCRQRFTSVYITISGDVQMCNSTTKHLGNVRKDCLSDIIDSKLAQEVRHLDTDCEHFQRDCFGGCMGYNCTTGSSTNICDTRCWNYLSSEDKERLDAQ
jgi:hypothetical protein